jgi:hypothetical protein
VQVAILRFRTPEKGPLGLLLQKTVAYAVSSGGCGTRLRSVGASPILVIRKVRRRPAKVGSPRLGILRACKKGCASALRKNVLYIVCFLQSRILVTCKKS